MAMCDDPSSDLWAHEGVRVPLIVTANDLSTLFAPLIRDGRMDKFLWRMTKEELLETLTQSVFAGLKNSKSSLELLVDSFPDQPLDFFSSVRSRMIDDALLRSVIIVFHCLYFILMYINYVPSSQLDGHSWDD